MARGAMNLSVISKFDPTGITQAQTGLDRLGGFAKRAGALMAGVFAAGTVAVAAFGVSSLRAADEAEKISRGLENAIKNAGVFGSTDRDIQKATTALEDHAQKLGELIGVDDEVLLSIEKTFMAVPELAGRGVDGIQKLIETTADVAAGANVDIESVGKAFIKVAGDEESALGKLVRLGVVFTDDQKAQYQALLDSNDQIGAQTYLIDQLGEMYAGAAEATASPLSRISVMWENFQETIGRALLPAIEEILPMLGAALAEITADPRFQQFLMDLTDAFIQLLPSIMDLLPVFMELGMKLLPAMIELTPSLIQLIETLTPVIVILADAFADLADFTSTFWSVFTFVNDALKIFNDMINQGVDPTRAFKDLIKQLPEPFQAVANFAFTAGQNIRDLINAVRDFLGLPPLSVATHSGSVSARDYVPGGLRMAAGGVVMPRPGGTLATIGEAGQAEAVIPLDRLDRMMAGRGGGGATFVVNVNGGLSTSAEIGRAVVDAIKKFERVSGNVFASA